MMAGCWPSSFSRCFFFFFFFFLTETTIRSIKMQKRMRPIYSHFDRTSLVNEGFIIYPKRELILAGPKSEISSERARRAHLARSGSQSERRIRFILLARGFSHIKKNSRICSLALGGPNQTNHERNKQTNKQNFFISIFFDLASELTSVSVSCCIKLIHYRKLPLF